MSGWVGEGGREEEKEGGEQSSQDLKQLGACRRS